MIFTRTQRVVRIFAESDGAFSCQLVKNLRRLLNGQLFQVSELRTFEATDQDPLDLLLTISDVRRDLFGLRFAKDNPHLVVLPVFVEDLSLWVGPPCSQMLGYCLRCWESEVDQRYDGLSAARSRNLYYQETMDRPVGFLSSQAMQAAAQVAYQIEEITQGRPATRNYYRYDMLSGEGKRYNAIPSCLQCVARLSLERQYVDRAQAPYD